MKSPIPNSPQTQGAVLGKAILGKAVLGETHANTLNADMSIATMSIGDVVTTNTTIKKARLTKRKVVAK